MKYKQPEEFFSYLKEEFGTSVFNDTQKCLAIASDMFEGDKQVTFLIKTAFNNKVYTELLKARNSTSENKVVCIERAIKILTDDCCLENDKAIKTVGWLANTIHPTEWATFKVRIKNKFTNDNPIQEPSLQTSEISTNSLKNKTPKKSWILDPINLEMVLCPAGEFIMGSPKNELGRNQDEIQHKVIISKDFYIGKYLITQTQYGLLTGQNPSMFKGDNNPVTNLNLNEINSFCDKLNSNYSNLIPQGYRFDLPTEAQWEYACRAGTNTALNNGKDLTSIEGFCSNLDEVAWFSYNSKETTHPVGLKKPNAWGIYDMLGNVWERCRDRYGEYPQKPVIDPYVENGGSFIISIFGETIGSVFANYILRGGSFESFGDKDLLGNNTRPRSAVRSTAEAAGKDNSIGFRVALVPID